MKNYKFFLIFPLLILSLIFSSATYLNTHTQVVYAAPLMMKHSRLSQKELIILEKNNDDGGIR